MIDRDDYPHPVSELLDHGDISSLPLMPERWFDYVGHYHLSEIDVPPLIDLAAEPRDFDSEYPDEFYAPIHAVRALGQLGDMAADDTLVQLLDKHEDDDLVENVIVALTMVGPRALDRLRDYANQPLTQPESRSRAIEAIYLFAKQHVDQRERGVQILIEALANYQQQSNLLNGFIVFYLIQLEATEAADAIAQAFAANKVETDIVGSWAEVQTQLGVADRSDIEASEQEPAKQPDTARSQRKQPAISFELSGSYSIVDHLKR